MKKPIYLICGLIIVGVAAVILPSSAQTLYKAFTENVIFHKITDFRTGIKNSQGPVRVFDSMQVRGNLSVTGSITTPISAQTITFNKNVNAANYIASTNLQKALDEELAVDLTKLLPGTTWNVANYPPTEGHSEWDSGQVTFSSTGLTVTINTGAMLAADLYHTTAPNLNLHTCNNANTYQLFNRRIYYSYVGLCVAGSASASSYANGSAQIFVENPYSLGFYGNDGTISILTKVR
ncbi:hypothetical protein C4546_00895 [Candidatus Parcubacteria bacterium]|jgi:hypothetical protein|nr:MAG: hypothetical protein C4546_00895 [Candidatus Parcubacteria bacterium]